MSASATLPRMAKKKPASEGKGDGEKRPTSRRSVALPLAWYEVAERIAAKGPTPIVWYLVKLIEKDAQAAGMTDLPPPPWKTEDNK